ncbi:Uncharacterised protein [Cedecea neteri]|uniref:Uncharacterized protein n=2 Tax=Cedecea neteri TaxID=158822 RepID=A0A291DXH7_9ENTR|nr:hypothetical protein [Cedecea neteri]ATF92389.1 hypothetical protein CO704_09970 [Cedecea neteri]SQC92552.1 Uncharacterised protein [Cedecea neteri]
MSKRRDILTCFLRDVALHTLQIHRDDGLYRHLRFKRPGTNAYYFDIVTWPGYLTITGDMGTWTFSRVSDMFNFFMDSHFGHRASFVINPGYWSEKFEAGAGRSRRESPCYEFDSEAFDGALQQWLGAYLENCDDEEDRKQAEESIKELCGNDFSSESEAYHALNDAYFPMGVTTYEILEDSGSMLTPGYHYLWICYAIVWGIERYRNTQLVERAMGTFLAINGFVGVSHGL